MAQAPLSCLGITQYCSRDANFTALCPVDSESPRKPWYCHPVLTPKILKGSLE